LSSQYAGNPASFPIDFTIPDDGDAQDAASVDIAFEALGDRTAWLKAHLTNAGDRQIVTASGTITAPDGVVAAIITAYGGGGGGGPGAAGPDFDSDLLATGGGGGGGSVARTVVVPIVAGEAYAVAIGAGGTSWNDGGDTTLTRVSTSTVLATFRGAEKGMQGAQNLAQLVGHVTVSGSAQAIHFDSLVSGGGITAIDLYSFGIGGGPVKPGGARLNSDARGSFERNQHSSRAPSTGGRGLGANHPIGFSVDGQGEASPQGFIGGSAGTTGATNIFFGGGSGGGGGAGPGGNGTVGGNGGIANSASNGAAGTNGSNAAANSGAGGGGGGGGGGGNPNGGAGGMGGTGGSGGMTITWLRGST